MSSGSTTSLLILQWPFVSLSDYDMLVEMEDLLETNMSPSCGSVDGHDAGSGEMNIFITTADPQQTFLEVRRVLQEHDGWPIITAAHRKLDADDYTVLWPEGQLSFIVR